MSTLPNTTETTTPRQLLEAVMADLGLSIRAEFVPFSQSRNKAEKNPSLNWRVTLVRNGRDILTTDYSAGCARTEAYEASVRRLGSRDCIMRHDAIQRECETGYRYATRRRQLPDPIDVIWSLTRDADVINNPSFKDWASELGFDPDSSSAERIYRECLEHALALRNGIGQAGLDKLIEAGRDY